MCDNIPNTEGHAVAGGCAIAVAQVLIDYLGSRILGRSIVSERENQSTSRNKDRNIFDYTLLANNPRITMSSPDLVKNEAADFIYTVAELLKSRYGCGDIGNTTNTNLKDVNLAFKEFTGWDYANGRLEYLQAGIMSVSEQKIIDRLHSKCPIIVQGVYQYAPVQHTWLYTGVKYGKKINELYINWGRGGKSNGWFAYGNNSGYIPSEFIFIKSSNGGGSIN